MSQFRDNLPWFPLFASNMLIDKQYRQMEPIEVALWVVMMMHCWANGDVPANPAALAKWIGWSPENVNSGLTERVKSFFKVVDGEFVSPRLEEHWQKHLVRVAKQKEGGRKGANIRYKKGLTDEAQPIGQPIAQPIGQPIAQPIGQPIGPYIKSNSIKSNSIPSPRKEKVNDPFVDAMEAFEAANNEVEVEV
jgi:uncharacterized protein YdaU (DUF1376 family)